MSEGYETIRDTLLGTCIGATIVDITATDTDEFLAGGPNHIYLHLSNGETIFATLGIDGAGLVGLVGDDEEEQTV